MKVFVVSTCIPEPGAEPCLPYVFASEEAAEALADEKMRREWDHHHDMQSDTPLPYPGDWRTAQEMILEQITDGSWGPWQITSHEVTP